ncbi:hypothetical protein QFZ74_004823 [Streptomyces sp. V3I7]|nr:hypothetical protein [Streptomyces sp. V3I7]
MLDEPVEQGELLVVRQAGEAAALDGQDLERGQLDAVEAVRAPALTCSSG